LYQLLAFFTPELFLDESIKKITDTYEICFGKIFVLRIDGKEDLLCTFNIEKESNSNTLNGAILLHRKKETNTLYTINSLNSIIRSENGGELNNRHIINWSNYRNSLILSTNNEVKIYPTQIFKIILVENL
jgi:hypothetical protein